MKELTGRQREILRFIVNHLDDPGYPPTLRDIMRNFNIASTKGVSDHLRALQRKGRIRIAPGIARGITVLD